MLHAVATISELVGRMEGLGHPGSSPSSLQLRRANRLKTIQASLEIENNTLTLEQVTAVVDGKRILGPPREIQEVRNAFATYERLLDWNPAEPQALLEAHGVLMEGLLEDSGQFRRAGVGVAKGEEVVHVAPPADRVPGLVNDLLGWLSHTDTHPLIAAAVTHYELEFIHPFADGNGRIGRLWQTLILARWKPLFAYLPVESVVRDQQSDYYAALAASDNSASATAVLEFMLPAIQQTLEDLESTEQVIEHVTEQVESLVCALHKAGTALSTKDLLIALKLKHRPTFLANYLEPALDQGLVERTDPDSPRSPKQRYRLTAAGKRAAKPHSNER